jgi:hypothetical protein
MQRTSSSSLVKAKAASRRGSIDIRYSLDKAKGTSISASSPLAALDGELVQPIPDLVPRASPQGIVSTFPVKQVSSDARRGSVDLGDLAIRNLAAKDPRIHDLSPRLEAKASHSRDFELSISSACSSCAPPLQQDSVLWVASSDAALLAPLPFTNPSSSRAGVVNPLKPLAKPRVVQVALPAASSLLKPLEEEDSVLGRAQFFHQPGMKGYSCSAVVVLAWGSRA